MHVAVVNRQKKRVKVVRLERIAEAVMAAEGCHPDAELSVVIGDDSRIRGLNRRYKRKDTATDVLAFAQGESPSRAGPLLGDVVISVETAARQAKERGHGLAHELAILLAHGILHLTGWSDETPAEQRRMMRRTEQVLKQIGEWEEL